MKYIRFYILVLLSFTWVSCDDFLTEMPETAVIESEAMTDIRSAEEIVIGVYSCFKNSNLYSGSLIQATEIQTDLLYAAVGYSNQFGNFYRWAVNPNESTLLSVYAGLYEIIARCNFFLDNAELVRNTLTTENDKDLMNKYETDIRFMRALAYSDLARTFCVAYDPNTATKDLGLPLYLHYREGNKSSIKKPRASLVETYNQILSDLNIAESLVERIGNDAMYVTEGAINALKARVYLYMQNWDGAIEYATKVIDSKVSSTKVYSLADVNTSVSAPDGTVVNEYKCMWEYDTANEIIWKIAFSTTDRGGALGSLFMGISGGIYRPNYLPAKWLLSKYEANDIRYMSFFQYATTMQGTNWEVVIKHPGNPIIDGSAGNYYTNMPKVLRLSETYLIRAEAYAMKEETNKANKDLSTLRKARIKGYGSTSYSQEKILEAIQEERAKELFLEGFRLHDLKRWGKGFERTPQPGALTGELYSSLKINGKDKRFTWPIPQHEITASQGLVIQNEQ